MTHTNVPDFKYLVIENLNLCPNSCFFCPRDKITRPKGTMTLEDFGFVVEKLNFELGEYCRNVHVGTHGETLLDKHLPARIARLMSQWPRCHSLIYSTLSVPLSELYLRDLLSSGLRELVVSFYACTRDEFAAIYGVDRLDLVLKNLEAIRKVRQRQNSHFRITMKLPDIGLYGSNGNGGYEKLLEFVRDMCDREGYSVMPSTLTNFGDGRSFHHATSGSQCSIVEGHKRSILYLTWDMNVVPCCWDYNSSIVFGNFRHQSLSGIFSSDAYCRFIKAHLGGELSAYSLCASCDDRC